MTKDIYQNTDQKEATKKKLRIAKLVREDKTLTPCSKLVFEHLLFVYHNNKTGQCNPSEPTLANVLGMSSRTVRKSIRQLKQCGLLTPQRAFNKSNQYHLNLDDLLNEEKNVKSNEELFSVQS